MYAICAERNEKRIEVALTEQGMSFAVQYFDVHKNDSSFVCLVVYVVLLSI